MAGFIKTFQYGDLKVSLETGVIARQASGTVIVNMANTVVMVNVVGVKEMGVSRGFFPLTVHYQERAYAAGRIPGGYFKREGRPSEREVLISRLIDRPVRPLFPDGFENEVQIVATVLALNKQVPADIPALIGASAALAISGIPFLGPLGAARVGYIDGEYVLNPTAMLIKQSQLDLVVAGTKNAVLMVESEAAQLSEEVMLGAVMFGHEKMQVVIDAINELVTETGKAKWDWQAPTAQVALTEQMQQEFASLVEQAYAISEKQSRQNTLADLKQRAVVKFCSAELADAAYAEGLVTAAFESLESRVVRGQILEGKARIDGRDRLTVRPINVDVGVLPQVHGSALFTRGETQALVVATLGSERDAQTIDSPEGDTKDQFMLHYNFPPYSVGEVGMMGSPKRREIGHGRLARRGIQAALPEFAEFPYVIRVVSEITESNGSSSMASVCGSSLALMDAGVPLKAPVAGIAMGLIKEGNDYAVLTDILGDEDHLGDMDFKVAGTAAGVTALQMDIKIDGITAEIMQVALAQAKQGRLHILGIMNKVLDKARENLSENAPRIITMKVHPDKVREIIGKGGVTIRALTEETGATIDISDDGTVKISVVDQEAGLEAKRRIEQLTADVEVGKTYVGKVVKIVEFGAFVNFLPGKDGLVHVSQISEERINQVGDVLTEGQSIWVKVMEVDRQGRIRLSIKDAVPPATAPVAPVE